MIATYQASFSAGLLGGALHALTGSDHIAAVLPLAINRRWHHAASFGWVWGVGHGLTSFALGLAGSIAKRFFNDASLATTQWAGDLIVAVPLIVIGAMGIWENQDSSDADKGEGEVDVESATVLDSPSQPKARLLTDGLFRTIMLYGSVFVHGASLGATWDGLPSLAPALVLHHRQGACFLCAYFISTAAAMALFAGLLGEMTYWLTQVADVALVHRLASLSSIAAFCLGVGWLIRALLSLLFSTASAEAGETHNNDGTELVEQVDHTGMLLSVISVMTILVVLTVALRSSTFQSHFRLRWWDKEQ